MVYIHELTDEQRRRLQRLRRRAVGRVSQRAHMVLLSGRGYSISQIAVIFECGEDVVRNWLHRYEEKGEAGLEDLPRPGRRPKDSLARQIIDAQASQSPRCAGLVQNCWTVRLLAAFLACRFGLVLSVARVRHYLHLEGWRWVRPRLAPASELRKKRDPQAGTKLALIEAAKTMVAKGIGQLLYLDECDLHLVPLVRAMWMKGQRLRVPTPGKNARWSFFGALNGSDGFFHWHDRDRKLAVYFVEFLEALSAHYPRGPLFLVMDSAPTHTAKIVQKWLAANPRIKVLWLPKYAAHEVNPAERIWGLMKDKVAANRLAGNISELVASARRFFHEELLPHPITVTIAA